MDHFFPTAHAVGPSAATLWLVACAPIVKIQLAPTFKVPKQLFYSHNRFSAIRPLA